LGKEIRDGKKRATLIQQREALKAAKEEEEMKLIQLVEKSDYQVDRYYTSEDYREAIRRMTIASEKYDKVHAHRKTRKHIKDHITSTHGDLDSLEEILMPKEDEISDNWTMAKDGKTYYDIDDTENDPDWLKDFKKKLMRK
jgi:iron-sulfur cluster repair protein YtfE (RIC family)